MYILYLYSIHVGKYLLLYSLSAECNDITSFGLPSVRHRRCSFRCADRLDCSGAVESAMSSDLASLAKALSRCDGARLGCDESRL